MTIRSYGGDTGFYLYRSGRDGRYNDGKPVVGAPKRVNPLIVNSAKDIKRSNWLSGFSLVSMSGVQIESNEHIAKSFRIAKNDCIAAMRSANDDALLLADLLQARSTLETANAYARAALRAARALKKRDVRAIKKYFQKSFSGKKRVDTLSEVPSAWLVLNFVIRPAIGSYDGCINILNDPFSWVEVRERKPFSGEIPSTVEWNLKKDIHLGECFVYLNTKVRFMNSMRGFVARSGLTDWVNAAYDLVPWSWAADYFANVGDVLGNLNPRYSELEYRDYAWGIKTKYTVFESKLWRDKWYDEECEVDRFERFDTPIGDVSFEVFSFNKGLKQASYLMSAIALTLKGKFK